MFRRLNGHSIAVRVGATDYIASTKIVYFQLALGIQVLDLINYKGDRSGSIKNFHQFPSKLESI